MDQLSFLKNIQFVDPRTSEEDFDKANTLRRDLNRRLADEPIFRSVRSTLDVAEKLYPANANAPASAASHATVSARSLQREAMSDLRSQLKNIHSTNTFQNFSETVPASTKESRVRGSFTTDAVNPENKAPSQTSININARPLNKAASRINRDKFLKECGIALKDEDEGEVDFFGRVTARLRDDVTPQQEKKILQLIKCLVPWNEEDVDKLKTATANDDDKDKDVQLTEDTIPKSNLGAPRIYTGTDGKKYLEMNAVVRDKSHDIVQKIISELTENIIGETILDDAEEERILDLVPQLVRLATLRIDLPGNVAKNFFHAPSTKSWLSLFEGSRINWDVILRRHFFEDVLFNTVSKQICGSFDKDDLMGQAITLLISNLFHDVSLKVNQAPPELSFARLVKEGGQTLRRTAEASDPRYLSDANEKGLYTRMFTSNGWENLLASFVGSFMHIGLTNEYVKERVTMLSAVAPLSVVEEWDYDTSIIEDQDEFMPYLISQLQEVLRNSVDEVQKVEFTGNSFTIEAELTGINQDLWNFIPTTIQGMVDAAKPFVLCHKRDWTEFDEDRPTYIESDMIDFSDMYPKRSVLTDKAEDVVKKLWIGQWGYTDHYTGTMFVAEAARPSRETMFTVCVAAKNHPDDEEWAKFLSLFGVQPVGLKSQSGKKKKSEDDSDDDDSSDDDDGEIGFPDPTEGYTRCAFIKRKSDGRYFQFIRPVADDDGDINTHTASHFISACDGLFILNSPKDYGWLTNPTFTRRRSYSSDLDLSRINNAPTVFVNTLPGSAPPSESDMKKFSRKNDCLFTPKATKSSALPASAEEANALLDWLVENAVHPHRGSADAIHDGAKAAAFDWPIEDPFMLA